MSATELTAAITGKNGPIALPDLNQWTQGRTLYGGASALIAYTHAVRAFADLPPLRSAQIGFVAPALDSLELDARIVRKGKNVTQLRSEIYSQGQLALSALFLFGAEREANALHPSAPIADLPPPPDRAEPAMSGKGPAFLQHNFELRYASDQRGPGAPVVRRWARLKDREGLDPVAELVLLGDVLPPGAMRAMQRPGPISSINWSFNLLDPAPQTSEGWWLTENASTAAGHGYSSERLRLWNASGAQMLDGLQCVAIFG